MVYCKKYTESGENALFMKDKKISLAGDLGSGKSTVGKLLTAKYGLETVSIGKIHRQMASDYGMDVTEFNVYMESHPEIDNELDARLKEYEVKNGNFLFDSRMAFHFVPSSFSVYMKTSPEIAAKRIFNENRSNEQYASVEDAVKKLIERRASESLRYSKFYGVDITDMSNYDYVLDTGNLTPQQVFEKISAEFENWLDK